MVALHCFCDLRCRGDNQRTGQGGTVTGKLNDGNHPATSPPSGVLAMARMKPKATIGLLLVLPHLVAAALVGTSARLPRRHVTMSLPLDSSLILDTVSPAIERRMQALACAVPAAISVLATRSSSGIPQIAEVFARKKSKTPSQVATKWGPRVFFGDAVVYMSRCIYHMRRGYSLACWSELIPLMVQNVVCFYLTRSRGIEAAKADGEKDGEKAALPPRPPTPRRSPPPLPSLLQDSCRPLTRATTAHPLSHAGCRAVVGWLARALATVAPPPWARRADEWLKVKARVRDRVRIRVRVRVRAGIGDGTTVRVRVRVIPHPSPNQLALDAAFFAALGLLMLRLPTRLMPLLCLWSV